MNRRRFLSFGMLLGAGCSRYGRPAPPLSRAIRFLWSCQGRDGGWHSSTYGLLKSGQSLTPFILDALLQAPTRPPQKLALGLAFLSRNLDSSGAVGRRDSMLE